MMPRIMSNRILQVIALRASKTPRLRHIPSPRPYTTNGPQREPDHPIFPEGTFAFGRGFKTFTKRLASYSALGLLFVGTGLWVAFEGAHMWVEHVELAPEADDEVLRWEWHRDPENWRYMSGGGTDPGLGFKARHAARAAWMASNWGTGPSNSVVTVGSPIELAALKAVDPQLSLSEEFIKTALSIAESKAIAGKLHEQTFVTLLSRHGAILERMGSSEYLKSAVAQYERAWSGLAGRGFYAAHIATRLGDLCRRLGRIDDALLWWERSVKLVSGDDKLPSSPFAQRILASTYVSLSAYYATSGQFQDAQRTEEQFLSHLRSISPPKSITTASSPEALHALYLLHRSSLLSIHLAEVLYAQQQPASISIQWLISAAESSERVALGLTGLPLADAKTQLTKAVPPPVAESAVMAPFLQSRSMRKPASSLLREARRTAAEAWNLTGLLYEATDTSKALECFERAVGWAGIDSSGRSANPGEGTSTAEWNLLLKNLARAKKAAQP